MRREFVTALVIACACGDNHRETPRDSASSTCVVRGDHVALRQIAFGCAVDGAPAYPDCLDGVVTLVTSPPNDPRLFLVELNGRIRIFDNGHVHPGSFLDIAEQDGGPSFGTGVTELGFLGLAFHPQYATNHQFFVYYTAKNSDTTDTEHPYLDTVARYTATEANLADPKSGVVLIAIPDQFSNHNGGMIEFGNDGYLYISTGDGGGVTGLPADPFGNAQNPHALLGKMLRIDVDRKDPGKAYGIPFDNPFVSGVLGAKEVFVLGLRNPWRWSCADTLTTIRRER